MADRTYPIRPAPEDDPRFTRGLVFDVTEVLQRHGYEALQGGDIVELQLALYRFLYGSASDGAS